MAIGIFYAFCSIAEENLAPTTTEVNQEKLNFLNLHRENMVKCSLFS